MTQGVSVKNWVLAVAAVAGAFLTEPLGGWDKMLGLLMGCMAADLVTGVLVAAGKLTQAEAEQIKAEKQGGVTA